MLGDNIKTARKNKGMTQEELAERLNVVRQTVSKWEMNLSVPDADLLEKLADVLNVDVHVLLGVEKPKCEAPSEDYLKYISEQLAKINEHEAYRMRTFKRICSIIGLILLSILILYVLWYVFGKTVDINESTEIISKGAFALSNGI